MDVLQFKFYGGQSALYMGLLNNEIDLMAWPVTKAQYDFLKGNVTFTVAPYFDLGDYEIGFNNNYTYSGTSYRNPFNYTEFRQAMACLIDKDGLIAGPNVEGFGTRIDTSVARPILDEWVNFDVSKYNATGYAIKKYPWDYNGTHALEILYNNGWFATNSSGWPTWADIYTEYQTPNGLQEFIGTVKGVLYPAGHEKQGQVIDTIEGYSRSDHPPRLAAGVGLENEMKKMGIGVNNHQLTSGGCYYPVMVYSTYHYYTAGWSFGTKPLHFYSMYTPVGIYPYGPNFYLIDNTEMTYHAIMEYPNSTSAAMSKTEALECQRIMVEQAHLCPLYSSRAYMAYRTGFVGIIDYRGYGLTTQLDFTMMNCYHQNYPAVNTIRYGTMRPPEAVNPIFSSWLWDYEVCDRLFTTYLQINPYKPTTPGKSPTGGDLPWMAYDWKYELMANGCANLTLYFRDDITWHDGHPFNVHDLQYTIYLGATYDDSWSYSDMIHVVNFVEWDAYTCSIEFDFPSYWSYLTPAYDIIPKHIYENIDIPSPNDYGSGHHGFWPGETAFENQTHSPLTWPIPATATWVGTNMWEYRPGSLVKGAGGGMTLDAYNGFWMQIMQGEIDFAYKWNSTRVPGKGYMGNYSIALPDLVMLANAYGSNGTGEVPFSLGKRGDFEPGCDLAPPAGIVGLSDLVTLARNYGKSWGENP